MVSDIKKICVIGAGAYGSAISEVFAENVDVVMLGLNYETMESINNNHVNPSCLCDIKLKSNISCRCDYECCKDVDAIFVATPVSAVRVVCNNIIEHGIRNKIPVIMCSKGIEENTCKFTTEIAEDIGLKHKVFVLSGPSFAHEIAAGLPAVVSLAGEDRCMLDDMIAAFSTKAFKLVGNDDIIGTQICGAMKNVLAVICGTIIGAGLGKSAVAMVITRAIDEIGDMIVSACGKRDTVYEACGVGDIILTCTNDDSRNIQFGRFLAGGGSIDTWTGLLAEGALTCKSIPALKDRFGTLPLFEKFYNVIYGGEDIRSFCEML